MFFFFKQKTAYEMRISDWSSDVCSSDLVMASHQFGVWGRRIEALGKSDNADNGVELGALMDKAASAAFVAMPAPVFAQLAGAQKMAIVDVFTGLLLQSTLRVAGAIGAAAGLPIGAG